MQYQEEQDYTKKFDASLWVRLVHYAKPFYKHLLGIMITMLACAGFDVIFPLLTREAIDTFVEAGTTSGLGLFFCEYLARGSKDARQMRLSDAVMVGVAQAVAVLPGLSRMGLMLCAGYRRGFQPAFSVQYAFLLSIPFLLGAGIGNVVRGLQAGVQTAAIPAYLVGMAVCVLAAIGAIQLLHRALSRKKLSICAFYCWGAAAFSLFLFLIT